MVKGVKAVLSTPAGTLRLLKILCPRSLDPEPPRPDVAQDAVAGRSRHPLSTGVRETCAAVCVPDLSGYQPRGDSDLTRVLGPHARDDSPRRGQRHATSGRER
jgi:hypothetical protein